MRWLPRSRRRWLKNGVGKGVHPVAALGADPATIIGAVTPVPILSEMLAGYYVAIRLKWLLSVTRYQRKQSMFWKATLIPKKLRWGTYGDHTGYYNEVVSRLPWLTTIDNYYRPQLYRQTARWTSLLGVALNEVFVPILQNNFRNSRFLTARRLLVSNGCCDHENNIPVMQTSHDGCAAQLLRVFMYTKFVIVCDDDVTEIGMMSFGLSHANGPHVTRPQIDNTDDYLDFVISGLGSNGVRCDQAAPVTPTESGRRRRILK